MRSLSELRLARVCVVLLAMATPPCAGLMSYVGMIPHGAEIPGVHAVGHVNGAGGGERSPFGKDFKAHEYTWGLELCLLDSDGDGETNGQELGDPCCMWSVQDLRVLHSSNFSNPGDAEYTTGKPPQPEFELAALVRELRDVEGATDRLAVFSARNFSCATWIEEDSAGESWFLVLYKGHFGRTLLGLLNVMMYILMLTCMNGGIAKFIVPGEGWTWRSRLSLLFGALLYVEICSGLLHLTADNPDFNEVPLFGELAVGFQGHHDDPAGITHLGWIDFLTKIDSGMALLGASTVLLTIVIASCCGVGRRCGHCGSWRRLAQQCMRLCRRGAPMVAPVALNVVRADETTLAVAGTSFAEESAGPSVPLPTLNIFSLVVIPLMYLMMASHRWTHCPPGDIPWLVWVMQKSHMLLTISAHNVHHGDYAHNFSLLTGWSNMPLNFVCDHILHPKHHAWMGIFLLWAAGIPAAVFVMDVCGFPECKRDSASKSSPKLDDLGGGQGSGYARVDKLAGAHHSKGEVFVLGEPFGDDAEAQMTDKEFHSL